MVSWIWWSLFAAFSWGLWGVVAKVALQGLSWQQVFFIAASTSFVASAVTAAVTRPELALPPAALAPAIAAGLLGTLGAVALYVALGSGGRAAVVIPLTAAYPVITAVLSLVILREQLGAPQLAAVGLFVLATILVSR